VQLLCSASYHRRTFLSRLLKLQRQCPLLRSITLIIINASSPAPDRQPRLLRLVLRVCCKCFVTAWQAGQLLLPL
jgi:hypothetical protein